MATTLADLADTPIGDITRAEPVRVAPDTTVFGVVERFKEHHCSAVLIEQDGELVGIFTERDLMSRVDITADGWENTPVGDVMTPSPNTVSDGETLEDALNVMVIKVCRHLPTVARGGEVDGVMTILDLLVYITEFFPEDFVNLPPDPDHEASSRWGG